MWNCRPKAWILPGIICIGLLTLLAMIFQSGPIERDLTERATNALAAKHAWASVELDGRDLTLKGTAPSDADRIEALGLVDGTFLKEEAGTWGVRVVDGTSVSALAVKSPYDRMASLSGDTVTLTGFAPTASARDTFVEAAKKIFVNKTIDNKIELAGGAPTTFADHNAFALDALSKLSEGSFSISDAALSISGVASSSSVFRSVNDTLKNGLPEGLTLSKSEIVAPLASPYTLSSTLSSDGKLVLKGSVPSDEARTAVTEAAAKVVGEANVAEELEIKSGAPADFTNKATFAVSQLGRFTMGEATLVDNALSVKGTAKDQASYKSANSAVGDDLLSGLTLSSAEITAPLASPYVLAATKADSKIELTGSVPSEAVRADLVAAAKAATQDGDVVDNTTLASGEGDNFKDHAAFSLGQLTGLVNGKATLTDSSLDISGLAKDSEAYDGTLATLSGDLPTGLTITNSDITAPLAGTYRFKAEKDAAEITLSGNVPSVESRSALIAKAQTIIGDGKIVDKTTIASGEGENFATHAEFGIDQLKRFETGFSSLVNSGLKVEGLAKDGASFTAANAALSGTLPDGLTISGSKITAPVAKPYVLAADKTVDTITLTGHVPSEGVRKDVANAAKTAIGDGDVVDQLTIASGNVPEFPDHAAFGLAQLEQLQTGKMTIADTKLTVEGIAKDEKALDAVNSAAVGGAPTGLTLYEAKVIAPAASPYVFNAVKKDAAIELTGNVPSKDARASLIAEAQKAVGEGKVIDKTTLASGNGPDFQAQAAFGLAALSDLKTGVANLTDEKLSVSGDAETEELKKTVGETLSKDLPNGLAIADVTITAPEKKVAVEEPVKEEPAKHEPPKALPVASPYKLTAIRNGDDVILSGNLPSQADRDAFLNSVKDMGFKSVTDKTSLATGQPDNFDAAANYLAKSLVNFDNGSARMADTEIVIDGSATSFDAYDKAIANGDNAPTGYKVISNTVDAPIAKPYMWSAIRSGNVVTLEGFVPDEKTRTATLAAAKGIVPDAKLIDKMRIADGVPNGIKWNDTTAFGASVLAKLSEGSIKVQDTGFDVSGATSSNANYDDALAFVESAKPEGLNEKSVTITRPAAKPFTLSATSNDDGVSVLGFAPDPAIKTNIEESAKRRFGTRITSMDIDLASGQPRGFESMANVGLYGLSRLSNGTLAIKDTEAKLEGVVPFGADLDAVKTQFENGVPPGFNASASLTQAAPPAPVQPEVCGDAIIDEISRNKVFFRTSRATILPDSFGLLDRIAEQVLSCPNARFEVSGHTDSDGSAQFNQSLSEARAQSIVAYMAKAGVSKDRFVAVGFGEEKPVAPNDSRANKAKNRRIEFRLLAQ